MVSGNFWYNVMIDFDVNFDQLFEFIINLVVVLGELISGQKSVVIILFFLVVFVIVINILWMVMSFVDFVMVSCLGMDV